MADAAILLAAGKGTRMGASVPKPLVEVGGRPMVHRLIDAVRGAGIGQISAVIGHGAEQMRASLPADVATPLQTVRSGTADAVACAEQSVAGAESVFVLVGDSPLLTSASLRRLLAHHQATGAACSFLTADFARHFPYARVLRDADGGVVGCIEERDCSDEQKALTEYLTSHYLFDAAALWSQLPNIPRHPVTAERYLTDIIGQLLADGQRIEALVIDDWRELVGLNTPQDVAWAEGVLGELQ
jgi:bifunctional N-acetylglucosamine-1-phosphate-uridyltransferase/glucosamine-1-phosphate-acetyltransferase GlmU-like protein